MSLLKPPRGITASRRLRKLPKSWYTGSFWLFICIRVGILKIGGHLSPLLPPRGFMAPRAPRKFKLGSQIDFSLSYQSE